jgi:hypothetical protein
MYKSKVPSPYAQQIPPIVNFADIAMKSQLTQAQIDTHRVEQGNLLVDRAIRVEKAPAEIAQAEASAEKARLDMFITATTAPAKIRAEEARTKKLEMETSEEAILNANQKQEEELQKRRFNRLYETRIIQGIAELKQNPDKEAAVAKLAPLMEEIDKFGYLTEIGSTFTKSFIEAETEVEKYAGASYWDALPKTINEDGEIIQDTSPLARAVTSESVIASPASSPAQRAYAGKELANAQRDRNTELTWNQKKARYKYEKQAAELNFSPQQAEEYIEDKMLIDALGGENGKGSGTAAIAQNKAKIATLKATQFIQANELRARYDEGIKEGQSFKDIMTSLGSEMLKETEGMNEFQKEVFAQQLQTAFINAQIRAENARLNEYQNEKDKLEERAKKGNLAFLSGTNNLGGYNVNDSIINAGNTKGTGLSGTMVGIFGRMVRDTGNAIFFDWEGANARLEEQGEEWGNILMRSSSWAYNAARDEVAMRREHLQELWDSGRIDAKYETSIKEAIDQLDFLEREMEFGFKVTPDAYQENVDKVIPHVNNLWRNTTGGKRNTKDAFKNVDMIKNSLDVITNIEGIPEELRYSTLARTNPGWDLEMGKINSEKKLKRLQSDLDTSKSWLNATLNGASDTEGYNQTAPNTQGKGAAISDVLGLNP